MIHYLKPLTLDFLLVAAVTLSAAASEKPNVLFITLDDLNTSLGCYGNPDVKTPHLDRLASQGTRFTRAYAQFAACAPSRASFLSGWRPERTTILEMWTLPRSGMPATTFLPQWFRQNGWWTARVDKIFHIGHDVPECWDVSEEPLFKEPQPPLGEYVVRTNQEIDYYGFSDRKKNFKRIANTFGENGVWLESEITEEQTIDYQTAMRCAELMREGVKTGKPFFVAAGIRRPHVPFILPQSYFDLYDPQKLTLPERIYSPDFESKLPDADRRRYVANYYAAVTFADAQVGRLLKVLDDEKLWANTIVVVFGDHGYALGEKDDYFAKGNMMETANRTALIITAPGMAKNQEVNRVVELLDIYPTLVELAELSAPPSGLDGRSLVPLIKDPKADWVDRAESTFRRADRNFVATEPAMRSVRDARYRYVEEPEGKPTALYDLENDPQEVNNLIASAPHAETIRRLRHLMWRMPYPPLFP